jgi:glucose-1-phosphate cytidylyltransferase
MKVLILAGGRGSRLAPLSHDLAKSMMPIGGKPFLWHLTQFFESQGFSEIGVALGYKGGQIEAVFGAHYYCLHTGQETTTAGRLHAFRDWVGPESFILTYGDGLSDIDLQALIGFHRSHGRLATVTAVNPPSAYGELTLEESCVTAFREKPHLDDRWINGGFFVLEPEIFSLIDPDRPFEEQLDDLASQGELMAFRHSGFWQAMDHPSDYHKLIAHWESHYVPWAPLLLRK